MRTQKVNGKSINQIPSRLIYLDEITGLLIIVMVVIHILPRTIGESGTIFRMFFFFMPWFYFKSGMLHKDCSIAEAMKKVWQGLMAPFVFYWGIV